jgi:hypothetical protein
MIGAITAGMFSGGVAPSTNSYESIQTYTVGSGGQATISFTSIPSTYKHLQLRSINLTGTSLNTINMTFNGSSSSYTQHVLYGDGSGTPAAAGAGSASYTVIGLNGTSTAPSAMIVDILDYTSTTKNKTVRSLTGFDANGSGYIQLRSGVWYATPVAINQIDITIAGGSNFSQFSSFALYGIKG